MIKIDLRSLKVTNHTSRNRPLHIPFYVLKKKEKVSPSDYQVYKLCTNPKDKKSVVFSLMVGIYKVGTPEEWLQFIDVISQVIKGQCITDLDVAYTLVKGLLCGDTLHVFQNEEVVQKERDSPAFTKYLAAVTEHIFPTKAYKVQKKSDGYQVFMGGNYGYSGGQNSTTVETGF
eukprot:6332810-Ditylum_brightwellii.AAC.1